MKSYEQLERFHSSWKDFIPVGNDFFSTSKSHSKTRKSEITEERTANENMLKTRILEIEKKINAAYELMISPSESQRPTHPTYHAQTKNTKEDSGYVTRNCDTIERPGSSHEPQTVETIPFELDWDQGKLTTESATQQIKKNVFRKKQKC